MVEIPCAETLLGGPVEECPLSCPLHQACSEAAFYANLPIRLSEINAAMADPSQAGAMGQKLLDMDMRVLNKMPSVRGGMGPARYRRHMCQRTGPQQP